MIKKIQCYPADKLEMERLRVRVIKAPLVDTEELRKIIFARTKAVVL